MRPDYRRHTFGREPLRRRLADAKSAEPIEVPGAVEPVHAARSCAIPVDRVRGYACDDVRSADEVRAARVAEAGPAAIAFADGNTAHSHVAGSGARPEPQIRCAQPLPISHCPQPRRSRAGRTSRSGRADGLRGGARRRGPTDGAHPTYSRPPGHGRTPTRSTAAPNEPRENSDHEAALDLYHSAIGSVVDLSQRSAVLILRARKFSHGMEVRAGSARHDRAA